jgi:transposase-like protein
MRIDARLRMVQYAAEHGIKPAARHFGCEARTIRKWLRRWRTGNHSRRSLEDRSRAPRTCPHKTSPQMAAYVVRQRRSAPCFGARRLKENFALKPSVGAIARILRQAGLTRPRKKKYRVKRDMRELKARFRPFEQAQVDTKYLNDIPYYVEQMWRRERDLPRFQYTWRDVRTGAVFLGFANELSQMHACCFIMAVAAHLKRTGHDLRGRATIQTDNGAEFSGQDQRTREDRGFRYTVENPAMIGANHCFIPIGRKNYQADVETLHERIEPEFFDLESFADRKEFLRKASSWQLWWNTTRKNSYKRNRSPDQILLEAQPQRDFRTWLLPAIDLDRAAQHRADLIDYLTPNAKGYYVPVLPARTPCISDPDSIGGLRPRPETRDLPSAICDRRSAVCDLRSEICPLRSAVCDLKSEI